MSFIVLFQGSGICSICVAYACCNRSGRQRFETSSVSLRFSSQNVAGRRSKRVCTFLDLAAFAAVKHDGMSSV